MKKKTDRAERRPGRKYLGVDLEDSVYDQLDAIAKADRRPLASLVRVILDQWLVKWNAEQKAIHTNPDDTYVTGRAVIPQPELRGVFGDLVKKKENHTIADQKK